MQIGLVDILRCPECGGELFLKHVRRKIDDDVVRGCIQCSECDKPFEIKKGIVDMLYAPDSALSYEMKYWDNIATWPKEPALAQNLRESFLLRTYDCLGKILQSYLHKKDSLLLFELGCGTGDTIELMPLNAKEVTYVGIDLSIARLLIASQRKSTGWKINLIRGDGNKCLFRDKVDVAVSFAALHHLNLEKALRAISASLKKDGLYMLFEPNRLNFLASLGHNFVKNCFYTEIYSGALNKERALNPFEVKLLAQSFGLTLKERKGMSGLSWPYVISAAIAGNSATVLAIRVREMLRALEKPVTIVDDFLREVPLTFALSSSFLQIYEKR